MGKPALKDRLPRVYPDHRATDARRLRYVYDDLTARYKVADGIARRVATMTAQAWLSYQDHSLEIAQAPKKRKSAMDIARLRRRRQAAAGHFLAGLRTLEVLSGNNGDGKFDLATELVKQGMDDP